MSLIVDRKTFLYMMLVFPLLKPNYFNNIVWLNPIYQFMLLFTLGYCILLYLRYRKIPSSYVCLFALLEFWLYIITYMNHGDLPEVGRICRGVLGLAFIFDLFSENINKVIKCLNRYFMFYISVNFLLVLAFPNGIYLTYSSAIVLIQWNGFLGLVILLSIGIFQQW